ncbi:hypothetical protein IWX49DRAFT_551027 [Phyllosticta citricarpa]
MSAQDSPVVTQSEVFGFTAKVINGDIYLTTVNGTGVPETALEQRAEEDHQAAKAGWFNAGITGCPVDRLTPSTRRFALTIAQRDAEKRPSCKFTNLSLKPRAGMVNGEGDGNFPSKTSENCHPPLQQVTGSCLLTHSWMSTQGAVVHRRMRDNGKQYRSMLKKFEEQFMRKNEKRTIDECENSDDDKFQAGLDSHLAKAELDIFIVVDGLDQLHMDDQRHFVNGLDVLVREHRKDANQCHLAVAISARDGFGDVKLMSHVLKQIWVKPEDNAKDVHGCLGKYLDSDVFQEQRKDQNGSSECFGRSGRWNYESSVRPALTTLTPPEEMDRIYEDYVKDFDFEPPDRDPKEQQITTRTTALLAQTTGSMPIKVLLEALTFNTTDGRLD